jgi:hypothetical protein
MITKFEIFENIILDTSGSMNDYKHTKNNKYNEYSCRDEYYIIIDSDIVNTSTWLKIEKSEKIKNFIENNIGQIHKHLSCGLTIYDIYIKYKNIPKDIKFYFENFKIDLTSNQRENIKYVEFVSKYKEACEKYLMNKISTKYNL